MSQGKRLEFEKRLAAAVVFLLALVATFFAFRGEAG